ncbi:uncharacterized protein LOC143229924 isoform X2 [Tachypleus tridentatus]|uniref:uncharacterized protein LOC143229924 isoform X2 n=1 Tax=Tachypleus tridentatus TaxID=6853 RepID=UPI003FD49A28
MGCTPSRKRPGNQIVKRTRPASSPLQEDMRNETHYPPDEEGKDKGDPPKWVHNIEECVTDSDVERTTTLENSTDSLISNCSFTSWQTTVSCDSGVYELDEEYAFVITEYSTPDKIDVVEQEFKPVDLELIVVGKACPKKLNCKERDRYENEQILEMLRVEGLVLKRESRATGGIRFDVVSSDVDGVPLTSSKVRRLPPIRLQRQQKQRKRKDVTYEEINEKLQRAEERRKQQEVEKLRKISTKDKIVEAMSAAAQQAEERKHKHDEKMEAVSRGREKYLQNLQEKVRAHEEKARKVRQRKEMFNQLPSTPERNECHTDFYGSCDE